MHHEFAALARAPQFGQSNHPFMVTAPPPETVFEGSESVGWAALTVCVSVDRFMSLSVVLIEDC